MESVQKIAQDFQSLLTDKDKKKLAGFMRKLGFDDVAAPFYDLPPESGKKVQTFYYRDRELRFLLFFLHLLPKR